MSRRALLRTLSVSLLGLSLAASAAADEDRKGPGKPGRDPARFALIGDVPYRDPDILKFDEVIREINASGVDFTVHTGDIKSGSSSCADELLQARFDQLQQLKRPLVYTPGDNEWTDCHRPAAGGFEPLDRLAKVRKLFFPKPGQTTGKQKQSVRTQASDPVYAEYVENVIFERAGVVFATLHVVGSNNDLALWSGVGETAAAPRQDRIDEVARRTKAVLAWIDAAFDLAEQRGASGVFLAMQADPAIEAPKGDALRNGFEEILAKISARTVLFARPVVLGHGDSHLFRMDKLLTAPTVANGEQRLEDFTRVENFGDLDVHWVEIQVDARTPEVFRVLPHTVEANKFGR